MKILILFISILMSSQIFASGCDSQFERYDAENVTLKSAESFWLRKKKIESVTCRWGYTDLKMKDDLKVYTAETGWGDYCEEVKAALAANYNHKVHLGFENAVFVPYDSCNGQMDNIEKIISGRITYTIDYGAKRYTFSYPYYNPETEKIPTF